MKIHAVLLMLSTCTTIATAAPVKINSKDSLTICTDAILADAGELRYKFSRKTATSVKKEQFTHWINATEIDGSDKTPVKVLCETSRDGNILSIEFKPGRWKM